MKRKVFSVRWRHIGLVVVWLVLGIGIEANAQVFCPPVPCTTSSGLCGTQNCEKRCIRVDGVNECEFVYGACVANVETCNNVDDNCNGAVDESLSQACTVCGGGGTTTCSQGTWTACSRPEQCNNCDDNANGAVDDGLTQACSVCGGGGSQTCSSGAWQACVRPEQCNNCDDNADGLPDNNVFCPSCSASSL